MWASRRNANGQTWPLNARRLCSLASTASWHSLGRHCTRMGTFLSLKQPGIASRPPPFVTCSPSSDDTCGARGLFPHHPLILAWFYSPALRLSACLGPSVIKLEMYKVELT